MSVDVLALIADPVICTDEVGRIELFNPAAERAFGYSASEMIGQYVEVLLPERYRAEHVRHVQNYAQEKVARNRLMGGRREVWGRHKNGQEFPTEAMVSRHTVNGRTVLSVVHRDIKERKEWEAQRDAIAQELDHRIKNLLAVVNSLVSLSARGATNVGELRESLLGRLNALAMTQQALGFGTQASTSLGQILMGELEQYHTPGGSNVILQGPPVSVGAAAATSLALIIHELGTNSAKYGALGTAGGRVTVTSALTGDGEDGLVSIEWRETGGAPVSPPRREGFGTKLINQMVKSSLRATISREYLPEGLICRLTVPMVRLGATIGGDVAG